MYNNKDMANYYLLKFIKKNPVNRFLVGFISIFLLGTVFSLIVLYPVRIAYFGFTTGDYLLNVKSVVAETTVDTTDNLNVVFCRDPRLRITAVNNVRTFYLTEDNRPVLERRLPENINYERITRDTNTCLPLTIRPDQRPNTVGKYNFCQEFDFFTEFNQKKTASFCSTSYEVIEDSEDGETQ